ncbi:MAG: M14 family zinc carboxypeptidase [Candidatus Zophobacter franzmannii]|nr:M14 family zinc carboxypeptidase [Candidatus Zophobacter franzmannii]
MKKSILLLLISMLLLSVYADQVMIRISDITSDRFYEENWDIASHRPGEHLDLIVDENMLPALRQDFPELEIIATEAELKSNLRLRTRDLPGYRTYDMLEQEMFLLNSQHSDISQLTTIGESWGKMTYDAGNDAYQDFQHDLLAMKISDNPSVDEDEPVIYFVGAHHAREPISVEVVMNLMTHLLENYASSASVQQFVDNYEIWFIPLLNPDGHKLVIDEYDVWWRKNIRDNDNDNEISPPSNTGYATDGVDLNRNYGWHWGLLGSSDNDYYATYHGTEAFSEPETQAFRDFLEEKRPVAGLSYHSHGSLVLYPFGYGRHTETADVEALEDLANGMAELIHRGNGQEYTPNSEWELYPCMGGTDDYAYGTHRVFGFTIELADTFIPDASLIPNICSENLNGQLYLLNRMNRSILKGHVLDSETGLPVEAKIFVNEIDGGGTGQMDYISNPNFGSFYRMLTPGDYTVTISADGYLAQSDIPFTILPNAPTELEIAFEPGVESALNIHLVDGLNIPLRVVDVNIWSPDLATYTTDDNGMCAIPTIQTGIHRVQITYSEFGVIDRELEVAPNTTDWYFTMQPATEIYTYETDTAGWDCSGAWGRSDDFAFEGTHSLSSKYPGYSMSSNSTATRTNPIDNSNDDLSLSFWAKPMYTTIENQCYLQLSYDDNHWFTIHGFYGNADWENYQFDLSEYASDQIYVRFYQYIGGTNNDGIFIDDFSIYQATSTVPTAEEVNPVDNRLSISTYPNPFSGSIKIELKNQRNTAKVSIYNVRGQLVQELKTQNKSVLNWDGKNKNGSKVNNGIYFINADTATNKVLLIR